MLIGVTTAGGVSGYAILGPGLLPGSTWRLILWGGAFLFQLRDDRSGGVLLHGEEAADVAFPAGLLTVARQGCEVAGKLANQRGAPLEPWEWSPPAPAAAPPVAVVPVVADPPAPRRLRPGYKPRRARLDSHRALIGVRPDREVAALAGVDVRTVQRMRERMLP